VLQDEGNQANRRYVLHLIFREMLSIDVILWRDLGNDFSLIFPISKFLFRVLPRPFVPTDLSFPCLVVSSSCGVSTVGILCTRFLLGIHMHQTDIRCEARPFDAEPANPQESFLDRLLRSDAIMD